MAKHTQAFKLITYKAKNFEVPDGRIEFKVAAKEITNPRQLATLLEPVFSYLNDYRKLAIDPAIEKYDKQLAEIRDEKEAKELAKLVNDELKKLTANLKKEAERRIEAEAKKLRKQDQSLAKFKLKIGAKVVLGAVKIGKAIVGLIATSGAKANEYHNIAKAVVSIAKEVKKGLATEAETREKLMKALEDLSRAKKENEVGKSKIKKVKDEVKLYENKLTSTRKDADKLANEVQKLVELGDTVEVSRQQEKRLNELLHETINFSTIEKNGREFAKHAARIAEDVHGKLDLKTVSGYAKKLKAGVEATIKVLSKASEIL